MAHNNVKHVNASSRVEDCSEDYHLSHRSLLHQKLLLDTEDLFKLGTNANPVRTAKQSVERIPKKRSPKDDATGHHNFRSVSKGLKRKREVPEPGGGNQNAPPKLIHESSRRIPEVATLTFFMQHEMPKVKKHHLSANDECTPLTNYFFECPAMKQVRSHDLQSRHLSGGPKPLARFSNYTPVVSTPLPYWQQKELKMKAQKERQEAARVTKKGLDCKIFVDRTDHELCRYFKHLDSIYYSYIHGRTV